MKAASLVILFATFSCAQNPSHPAALDAACGPPEVQFDAQAIRNQPLLQFEAGKSLVYVVEVFDKVVGQISPPNLASGA